MKQKDANTLMNKLNIGKHTNLNMKDEFQFECTSCGKCCLNNTVLLNCYDIIRLRHGLKFSTTQILQSGLISFNIGPHSGLPVCTLSFQELSDGFAKCPFLSPSINKREIKSKSELRRLTTMGGKINKWLCSVHNDRPINCRLYPCGRIKSVNKVTGKISNKFILQNLDGLCPGFKEKKKQTLSQYLKESEFKHYDEGSSGFASLMKILDDENFFVATKDNDGKGKLDINSKTFLILSNIMYNFDSFNYFSNDPGVLKTINDPKATQKDFMYVSDKIKTLIIHLTKLFKKYNGDDNAIMEVINNIPTEGN